MIAMEATHHHHHQDRPLKLYFIPYLATGHMIPTGDIARFFASRGHHVTIITSPSNSHLFLNSNPYPNHFRLQTFHFPSQEVGLPAGVENVSATTDLESCTKIYFGMEMLQGPIKNFMEHDPPDCIIADFLCPWVHGIANKLGVPMFVFNGFPLFTICAMDSVRSRRLEPSGSFVVPDIPHRITMNTAPPKFARGFIEPLLEAELKSHGLIVNNFVELDGEEYVQHYERTTGLKVWHLGPACLARRTTQEKAERGLEKSVVSVQECVSWLNRKEPNSVVYISFGTVVYFLEKQLYEIACGVEASGHEFIWVVPEKKGKENESEEEKEKWLPEGFEKKGMIIRGWAPQVAILEHPAVGAILTHCGWNSTVEALCAGVPMITWPVHSDQFYNERLMCDVRGVGVEVGVDEWCDVGLGEREKLVGRERIEKAMRRLMDGGDEAEEIRRRAQEFGKKARAAVEEGGSSHKNLTTLIDEIKRLRFAGKPLDIVKQSYIIIRH